MRDLKLKANEARKKVLSMIHKAGTSHIASNFSVIDIATVVYDRLQPDDEVVWSKGWAAATIYYFLAKQNKIPESHLLDFPNPPYLSLAEPSVNGVNVAGGSMGHGLPVALGMALAKKRSGEEGTIYCIISDGELNEGTTWESAALAHHHKLDNLILFIDVNKVQAMGFTKDIVDYDSPPIEKKFDSFGWNYIRIDGHDYNTLVEAIEEGNGYIGRPCVIVCDTVKGKGVSFMEGLLLYHYKNVDDETYRKAMKELE